MTMIKKNFHLKPKSKSLVFFLVILSIIFKSCFTSASPFTPVSLLIGSDSVFPFQPNTSATLAPFCLPPVIILQATHSQ